MLRAGETATAEGPPGLPWPSTCRALRCRPLSKFDRAKLPRNASGKIRSVSCATCRQVNGAER